MAAPRRLSGMFLTFIINHSHSVEEEEDVKVQSAVFFIDHVLYKCQVLHNYHSQFILCNSVVFLTKPNIWGRNLNSSEAFWSCEFSSRTLGVKESRADLVVQPPLTSDLSLGALIRVRRLSWSSGKTGDVFSLRFVWRKKKPHNNSSSSSWRFYPASQSAEVKTFLSSFSQETIKTKFHTRKSRQQRPHREPSLSV